MPETELTDGPGLLSRFLDANGISREQCATSLKVSRTALYYWLAGRTSPGEAARQDIATWTGGKVPSAAWGPHVDHRKKADGEVEPFDPASEVPHDLET